MRYAARTDHNQTEIVAALRHAGALVCSLAAVGQGVPDLLVFFGPARGLVLMEVKDGKKSPSARSLTAAQRHYQALGWPVTVVNNVDDALAALRSS